MKKYRIVNNLEKWGLYETGTPEISETELIRLSQEWDIDIETLMEDLEEIETETTCKDLMIEKGLVYHHTAWEKGYISRKDGFKLEEYAGRFGKGYKVHIPCWTSTQYHLIAYYVK